MKTYTVTRTTRSGNSLSVWTSRKYRASTPADAARFYATADGHDDYVDGGIRDGIYTLTPAAGSGMRIFVRVVEEVQMTVPEARKVIRSMTRENYDSALADRACAVLSDSDPVFSEASR